MEWLYLAIFNKIIFWKCICACALFANWSCKLKWLINGK